MIYINNAINKFIFVKAVNQLVTDKNEIIVNLELVRGTLFDSRILEAEHQGRYDELISRYEAAKAEFDDALWGSLLEYITVRTKDDVRFIFKDGTEIQV